MTNKTILIENYIRLVLETDKDKWARTDLPINPDSDESHNDVRTDLPILNKSQEKTSKKYKKPKKAGYYLKIALALAASAGTVLNTAQQSIMQNADNNPGNSKAVRDANRQLNYLAYVGNPDFVEKYNVDEVDWSKGVKKPELVNFIKDHEDFSALPYYDNGNVTIGYGSNIDRKGKTGKASKHPGINNKDDAVKNKAIKKAVKLAYSTYGIKQAGETKTPSASGISEAEAKTILDLSLNDHISLLHSYSPWVSNSSMPSDVLFVLYDMSYNIGPAVFSRLFKNAGKSFENFVKSLAKYEKSGEQIDIVDAVDHLYNAIKEVKDSNAYRSGVQARDNYIQNNPNAASWKTRYELHIERLNSVVSDLEAQIK